MLNCFLIQFLWHSTEFLTNSNQGQYVQLFSDSVVMAQYRSPDPDERIECPYDRVHMVNSNQGQYVQLFSDSVVMAQYRIPEPDELIECPYDRVHMVNSIVF